MMKTIDAAIESLTEAMGTGFEFRPLRDLVADSVPTHIIGAKVFLVVGFGEPAIVKIGHEKGLRHEVSIIERLSSIVANCHSPTAPRLSIRIPRVIDFRHLPRHGESALTLALEGFHTLDACRIAKSRINPKSVFYRTLRELKTLGLFWSGLAARNLVLKDERGCSVALVDWERGYQLIQPPQMPDIYIRSIELIEETSALFERVLPYWARDWPSPNDIGNFFGTNSLVSSIDVRARRDPRITALCTTLGLPFVVTDCQYFRLIQILCSITERRRSVRSISYACDQIEYFGGVELRVKATLLAQYLESKENFLLSSRLEDLLIKIGFDMSRLVYSNSPDEFEEKQLTYLAQVDRELVLIGVEATRTRDWWSDVIQVCRQLVLVGEGGRMPEFKVLFWI